MKTICHDCGMAFPVNPEFANLRVNCPHCGASRILRANEIIRDRPKTIEHKNESSFDGLGFALGLLLNVPGVFIAALVNGRRGAISSLWGLLVDGIIVIIGFGLMAAGI